MFELDFSKCMELFLETKKKKKPNKKSSRHTQLCCKKFYHAGEHLLIDLKISKGY